MSDNVIYGVDFKSKKSKQESADLLTAIIIDGCLVFKTQDTSPSEYQAPAKDGA